MSLILDGSAGVTFPNSTVQASSGVVLQVVGYSGTPTGSTTSSTYGATGISASITPKFSTSKILVIFNSSMYTTAQNQNGYFAIYRGASSISPTTAVFNGSAGGLLIAGNITYLDSPATTTSTTYNIYFKTNGGTLYFNPSGSDQISLTLMEIAG